MKRNNLFLKILLVIFCFTAINYLGDGIAQAKGVTKKVIYKDSSKKKISCVMEGTFDSKGRLIKGKETRYDDNGKVRWVEDGERVVVGDSLVLKNGKEIRYDEKGNIDYLVDGKRVIQKRTINGYDNYVGILISGKYEFYVPKADGSKKLYESVVYSLATKDGKNFNGSINSNKNINVENGSFILEDVKLGSVGEFNLTNGERKKTYTSSASDGSMSEEEIQKGVFSSDQKAKSYSSVPVNLIKGTVSYKRTRKDKTGKSTLEKELAVKVENDKVSGVRKYYSNGQLSSMYEGEGDRLYKDSSNRINTNYHLDIINNGKMISYNFDTGVKEHEEEGSWSTIKYGEADVNYLSKGKTTYYVKDGVTKKYVIEGTWVGNEENYKELNKIEKATITEYCENGKIKQATDLNGELPKEYSKAESKVKIIQYDKDGQKVGDFEGKICSSYNSYNKYCVYIADECIQIKEGKGTITTELSTQSYQYNGTFSGSEFIGKALYKSYNTDMSKLKFQGEYSVDKEKTNMIKEISYKDNGNMNYVTEPANVNKGVEISDIAWGRTFSNAKRTYYGDNGNLKIILIGEFDSVLESFSGNITVYNDDGSVKMVINKEEMNEFTITGLYITSTTTVDEILKQLDEIKKDMGK